MQLDTRIPMMMGQMRPVRFQPETQMESLAAIAPAVNAMRQVQQQRVEAQQMQQRSAALDQLRQAAQGQDLNLFADALIGSGDNNLMQEGAKLKRAILEEAQFKQQYGGLTGNLTPEGMAALAGAGTRGVGIAKELGQYVLKQPERYTQVGPNVLDRFTGQIIQAPPKEAPANALVPGAAPTAGGLTQDQTSRMLQQRGFRLRADGTAEPIPGGPADPDVIRRQSEARAAGKTPAAEKPSVTEQQAATATARLLRRATEISEALKRNPGAEAPGAIEAGVQNIPGLSIATNLVRSTDRQIVATAQDDILDALLYLATGAAYNKEQLQQQKSAYLASWSDDPPTRAAKRQRLAKMVQDAKIRAGKAWTPELDRLMETLLQSPTMRQTRTGGAAPTPTTAGTPAGGAPRPTLNEIFGR